MPRSHTPPCRSLTDRVRAEAGHQTPPGALDDFLARLGQSTAALEAGAARILDKPYGRNILVALEPDYGISLVQMHPGGTTSLHTHARRREIFVVRQGELALRRGSNELTLRAGDVASSSPNIPHRLANGSAEPLEILELFSPNLLDDKTRLSDRYGRALGAVDHRQ